MLFAKLIITVVTALATLILLYLNYRANKIAKKAVKEMQLAREEEYRPYIYLDFAFSNFEMDILLKNDGKAPAFNIQFTPDQNFKIWNALTGDKEYYLKDMAITDELEMLPPGSIFNEWMDQSIFFFRNNEERRLTGKITYEDAQGKKFQFSVDIDLEPHFARMESTQKDLPELIKAVEEIRRLMERP